MSAGESKAGARHDETTRPGSDVARPTWDAVAELLAVLAETRGTFPSASSPTNWISAYEPGRRLRLEAGSHSTWVRIEHVRACWNTLESRGQICRRDVLEPGRQSAFMMALFAHVPGVREEPGKEPALALAGAARAASA